MTALKPGVLAPDFSLSTIPTWAEKLGLDISQGVIGERIKEDRQSGIRSGVNGTPTFFVNGTRFDGAPDYASLLASLESELGKSSR
jgi:protein-disulfide isomerase